MANRWMNQYAFSLEKSKCFLYGRFTVGAAGAPTLDAVNSKGVTSITRTGVGKYNVVLNDNWNRLFLFEFVSVFATPASINAFLISEQVANVSSPSFVVQFQSAAGSAVELASGEDIRFEIILKNSTAP